MATAKAAGNESTETSKQVFPLQLLIFVDGIGFGVEGGYCLYFKDKSGDIHNFSCQQIS